MSESLNVAEATSHAAWTKGEQVTVSSEAGRRRGTPNPCWLRHPNAEPQARTRSEPGCSVVRRTHSNVVSGSAEPLIVWRRQHPPANPVARPVELPGVAGRACGESCSREGGRSGSVRKVRGAISATREGRPNAVSEVGGDRISDELPVMVRDAKGLRFRRVPLEVKGSLYSPAEGVVKQAMCQRAESGTLSTSEGSPKGLR
jgi:hypothetical protein